MRESEADRDSNRIAFCLLSVAICRLLFAICRFPVCNLPLTLHYSLSALNFYDGQYTMTACVCVCAGLRLSVLT